MRFIVNYIFALFVLLGNCTLLAQTATNPFELQYRESNQTHTVNSENPFELSQQKNQASFKSQKIISNKNLKSATTNPFDILEKPPVSPKTPVSSISSKNNTAQSPAEKRTNILFWVILFLLLFFTTIISVSRKRLEQIYGSFFNDNLLRQVYRLRKNTFSLSYLLLYLLFFLNAGVFIFVSSSQFDIHFPSRFSVLLLICLAVGVALIIKHILLLIIGNIFPIKKEIQLYSFTIMVFSILLGIVLLPINILIAFAPLEIGIATIYLAIGVIIAFYLYRSLRALSIGSKYLMLHKFHFFLYLCAIEILPVIVLLKIILLRIE